MFKRMFLFFGVNFLIIVSLSIIFKLLNISPYLTQAGINYQYLLVFALFWGMSGSIISLLISRWSAKRLYQLKIIDPNTQETTERNILSMVYNSSRAAGLTVMPEVGYYASDEINAFATGPTRSKSLVALSTGLLNNMDRDSIEGVIGHEVAHIANGDMVTMTLLQGIVNSFVIFLSRIIALVVSRRDDEEGSGSINYLMFHIVSFIVEIILMFLGSMVIAYFSRRREYKADAGSAKLVGKNKMIKALQHLSGNNPQSSMSSFKISGSSSWFNLFSTHPRLEDRIKALQSQQ